MNIEKLKELKSLQEAQEILKETYSEKKKQFEEENIELIEKINNTNAKISYIKEILRENAETGYLKDGNKKRLGGIGIRITKALDYNEKTAYEWAKEHKMCLTLDKKNFEKIAKTQELEFVTINENIVVTFPKEIILNEEYQND